MASRKRFAPSLAARKPPTPAISTSAESTAASTTSVTAPTVTARPTSTAGEASGAAKKVSSSEAQPVVGYE